MGSSGGKSVMLVRVDRNRVIRTGSEIEAGKNCIMEEAIKLVRNVTLRSLAPEHQP